MHVAQKEDSREVDHLGVTGYVCIMARRTVDIAWAAGLFEGEGSVFFGLVGPKNKDGVRTAWASRAEVTQKDRWVLDRLQALFGGTVVYRHRTALKYTDGTKDRPIYAWRVRSRQARQFLMTVYVLLSPRRQAQVRWALNKGPKPPPR